MERLRPTADQVFVRVLPEASSDSLLRGVIVAIGDGLISWDREVELPPLGSVVTFPARLRTFRC